MAKFEDVDAAVDALKTKTDTKFAAIVAEIAALKAAGIGATPEQLDSLLTKVQAISAVEDTDTDNDPNTPA